MEENLKHTPGPWKFHDIDFKVRGTGDLFGMHVIAKVSPKMNYSPGKCTQWENGRLIAAAPELLQACLIAYVSADENVQNVLRNAIKKATGL